MALAANYLIRLEAALLGLTYMRAENDLVVNDLDAVRTLEPKLDSARIGARSDDEVVTDVAVLVVVVNVDTRINRSSVDIAEALRGYLRALAGQVVRNDRLL